MPELEIEREAPNNGNTGNTEISGNRIVNINFLLHQMKKISQHEVRCIEGGMRLTGETRKGLKSTYSYCCTFCNCTLQLSSHPVDSTINVDFVWGLSAIGTGFSQGEELCAILDLPFMRKSTYQQQEKKVRGKWETLLLEQMQQNAENEKAFAIEAGQLEDGVPFITVIADGGWAKRSYGHSYSSLSGVACIIGARTKKILYLGIRNKFCFACTTSSKKHECFKNFKGSSTSMEQDIIVAGFNSSEKDYGLRYKYLIGDGDSSVYARIIEKVTYGRNVLKMECANHVTRAFTAGLYKLTKDCATYDIIVRKMLKNKIPHLKNHIRAILASKKPEEYIRSSVKIAPFHVFGDHSKCDGIVCKQEGRDKNIELLQNSNLWETIQVHVNRVASKADRLTGNVTTNFAERYMSMVAKFTGGKRSNLVLRGIYQNRCVGAALAYNSGYTFHKLSSLKNKKYLDNFCNRRALQKLKYKKYYAKKYQTNDDCEYGPQAAEPDMSMEALNVAKENFLGNLNAVNIAKVEIDTRGQRNNLKWFEHRRNLLTASNFSKICCRRSTTPADNLLKALFYKNTLLATPAMQYGIDNEQKALKLFEEKTHLKVHECGLFISVTNKYLGASPDGILNENDIVEVKCLYSIRNSKIRDAINKNIKLLCVTTDENGDLKLKNKHAYMYQIQGQMQICNKNNCYLVLYTDIDLEIIKIKKNSEFCNEMIIKLSEFWENHALPELVDSRLKRGLPART